MANTHSLVVRLPAATVDAMLTGELDLGRDQFVVGGPASVVPWVGDLDACRHQGTWHRGRSSRRVTVDVVPVSDRSALVTVTGWGLGIDTATIVDLAERLRHRVTTGPDRIRAEAAPVSVVQPIPAVSP